MAKLILRAEDGSDQEFSLDETGSLTIGRSPECDITITDNQASRRHCSVVRLTSGYEVADLGSTNGTLVNSTLMKKHKLKHGDKIRIGACEIVFSDPASSGAGGDDVSSCVLIYAKGDKKGEKVELTQQRTTIGRKATNTVPLDDPVCSGYHCEIVRDLNGYTIRDLGSTNGTLVNSEMITEAQLTHGARVRIGNVRFVFQDPAMAEIDLELAGIEDEEDWGMMRDLDLAAVRKRNPATIVYTVLLLAILGGGGYMLTLEGPTGVTGPQPPPGNLHTPFSFESKAARLTWRGEPAGDVALRISEQVKGQGKSSLEIKAAVARAEVFYSASQPGGNRYQLKAKIGARGTTARIGLLWSGLGLRRWVTAPPVTTAALGDIDLVSNAPSWATSAKLGIILEGQGAVYVDDLSLVRLGPAAGAEVEQNDFTLSIVDGTDVDFFHAGAPILANGHLFARDASGNPVDASGLTAKAEAADDEHIRVTIEGGAAILGLTIEEVRGFLSRGGFRAFTPNQEKAFHPAFPETGALALEGIRKLLLGPSGQAFSVLGATDDALFLSEATVDGRRRTWTIVGPSEGGSFSFRIKTDLKREGSTATDAMTDAITLYNSEKWGEFLTKAQRARAEFPFASKALRNQLAERIQAVEKEYVQQRRALDREVADYQEFRDLQSLENARQIIDVLTRKFQIEPGKTERGEHLAGVVKDVAKEWLAALQKKQGEAASARLEQALYVHIEEGELYSAALLLSYVAWKLPDSPQASQAQEELDKIEKSKPQVIKVLKSLGLDKKG